VKLRSTRSDLTMMVVDMDEGCGVIRVGHQELISLPAEINYDLLESRREELLNLVSVSTFFERWLALPLREEAVTNGE